MREGITFRNIRPWRDLEPCLLQTANVRLNLTISQHRNLFTYLSRELSRADWALHLSSLWYFPVQAALIGTTISNNFRHRQWADKNCTTNSYRWIGRKTTIFGWNNAGSKRQEKGKFGHLVQISVWLKLGSESLYLKQEILRAAVHYVCFFFTAY